jgi:hypothetical protein
MLGGVNMSMPGSSFCQCNTVGRQMGGMWGDGRPRRGTFYNELGRLHGCARLVSKHGPRRKETAEHPCRFFDTSCVLYACKLMFLCFSRAVEPCRHVVLAIREQDRGGLDDHDRAAHWG